MSFLKFDKEKLVNLEYSLARESLSSNRAGSFASTTISGCNTRKYHGLLICPLEEMGGENHVLLSSLDITVIQHEKEFNLGIHKYEGDLYVPRGHKYLRDYDAEKGSRMTYRVGGVVLTREMILVHNKEQILIKITLEEAHSATRIQLRPFLAFRNMHKLSKANLYLNRQYSSVPNGIKSRMYEGYPYLYMQTSKQAEFVAVPDWYYNIEYLEEQRRGYDYKEDLYVPGYFELPIKKGESIIFSASTEEMKPAGLKRMFSGEIGKRIPLDSFSNCLNNSAEQFFVRKNKSTELLAGFPWHGVRARETFIALPGLAICVDKLDLAEEVISSMIKKMSNGLFPNSTRQGHHLYNSIDAPLWFIRVLQLLEKRGQTDVWKKYKSSVIQVIEAYLEGTHYGIHMHENGLIAGERENIPLTWMDAMIDGKPVTLRSGYPVEVNALWYNAVCQVLKWTGPNSVLGKKIKELPELIKASFIREFWIEDKKYLADYVDGDFTDHSVRPNQVIATSLEYSPLDIEQKKAVLDVVQSELLTIRGLRTLSPKNENYQGIYDGNQQKRDSEAHQGSVYTWLIEHYTFGYMAVHKKSGLNHIKRIYEDFEVEMSEYGIGTIAELFDGNLPHEPRGGISFSASVAALIRIRELIESYN